MFNGWSYPLTTIPAGWNSNSKWKLTYSSCQKLLGKDRIYEIGDPTKTQRGDIIYTFDSSQAEGKQHPCHNCNQQLFQCHWRLLYLWSLCKPERRLWRYEEARGWKGENLSCAYFGYCWRHRA